MPFYKLRAGSGHGHWSGSCKWGRRSTDPTPGSARENAGSKGELLSRYLLKLYVSGQSPRTELAVANLRHICEEELSGEYDLEIVDVAERPEVAESDRILATPTLIKQLPPPLRRVIGDLSDRDKVLLGLEVRPKANRPPK